MRCILIDAKNSTVREVDVDEEKNILSQCRRLLDCSITMKEFSLNNNDSLVVDADGKSEITSETKFFSIDGYMVVGNGLIIGCNKDITVSLEEIEPRVRFHNIFTLDKKQRKELFR